MTIIAGFKCLEGVVLCADTQETFGGVGKRNIPKLRVERVANESGVSLAAAFCGATNNGPFVDKLADLAWNEARQSVSLADACVRIERSIKRTYEEYGKIYQPGYMPDAELVYGVKADGMSRMFHAVGPIVNEQDRHITGGAGAYLADFLASKMSRSLINVRQLVILAAYVLFQTKAHVDGCGGDSHIVVLPHTGRTRELEMREVEILNTLVACADNYLGDLPILCADLEKTEEQITEDALLYLDLFYGYRRHEAQALEKWKKAFDYFENTMKKLHEAKQSDAQS